MRKLVFWFCLTVMLGLSLIVWGFWGTVNALASKPFLKRDAISLAQPRMADMCKHTPICGRAVVYGCTRQSAHKFHCLAAQLQRRVEAGGCIYKISVTPTRTRLLGPQACINGPSWTDFPHA